MNPEIDDSNQVEIYFMQKRSRRRYSTIGTFFDRHGDTTCVEEIKFLFGAEEPRTKSLLKVIWNF